MSNLLVSNQSQNQLKIASLNFSGINISPFQYHDGSEEKNLLDRTFKTFFDTFNQNNPNTEWNIAKIDKLFQKERYSILYRSDCGCIRDKLLTKDQFQIIWDHIYEQNQGIISHLNLSNQKINKLRTFDYILYQAYVQFLFGSSNINRLDKSNIQKYKSELKKWHSKAYLNNNTKIKYIKDYIIKENLDVLFLQEALTQKAKEYLPNDQYSLVKNADSMIIHKRETYFMQDTNGIQEFDKKYKNVLNFNKDSCYLKTKDILLISVHLSSKSSNIEQAKTMFSTLSEIQNEYKNLKIIIGIDANHKLQQQSSFKVYPFNNSPTTRKKRTNMQCQFQKSDKLVQESKDYIITNFPIISSKIQMIHSETVSEHLLPNQNHPFDHFLIAASIEFDKEEYRDKSSILNFLINPMIKILVEADLDTQSPNRTFEEIVGELVARIVPPEAGQPFRGFKLVPQQEKDSFVKGFGCARRTSAPRSQQVNSPINFDNHHLINWDGIKKLTTHKD